MTKSYLRTLATLLTAGALLTACGGSPDPDPATPTSTEDKGLAYAKCMREHGVPKFPDPSDDGKFVVGKGVDAQSPEFQQAQQACQDLSPQGQAQGGGGTLDPAKVSAWAQCVREHGEPTFADPEVNGTTMQIDLTAAGINPQDAA